VHKPFLEEYKQFDFLLVIKGNDMENMGKLYTDTLKKEVSVAAAYSIDAETLKSRDKLLLLEEQIDETRQ
jgi:hypothetical protein